VAHVQDRGKGERRRWQARYRDPDGRERTRTFERKLDAQRWLDEVTTDLVTGRYVSPDAGRVTFETFAGEWLAAQTFDPSTREAVDVRLRVHLLPTFGRMRLGSIKPSTVQAWLRGRAQTSAPSYVRTMLATLSAVLAAAVEDELIPKNPCDSKAVRAPKVDRTKVEPWTRDQLDAVAAALPAPYRALVALGAGCGLRQGEMLGLRVEDVDFLGRRVHVRRQVKLLRGHPVFALPKGRKDRTVPLPDVVAVALSERLRRWPARTVVLPWEERDGEPQAAALVFTSRESKPLNRNYLNSRVWKPALEVAGVEPSRANGMHALRHYYASALLDGGVSIRAVAEHLGHADPGFTLRTYAHLMPNAEDRARTAIDAALGPRAESVRNGEGCSGAILL
jgi:integrase